MQDHRKLKIVAKTILGLMVLTLVYFLVTTDWMAPSALTVNCALVLGVLSKFVPWWLKLPDSPEGTPAVARRIVAFTCMVFVVAVSPGVWTGVLWSFNMTGGQWSTLTVFCFIVALLGSLCALHELLVCVFYLIFPWGRHRRQVAPDMANA